jgi:hypothetical protein
MLPKKPDGEEEGELPPRTADEAYHLRLEVGGALGGPNLFTTYEQLVDDIPHVGQVG